MVVNIIFRNRAFLWAYSPFRWSFRFSSRRIHRIFNSEHPWKHPSDTKRIWRCPKWRNHLKSFCRTKQKNSYPPATLGSSDYRNQATIASIRHRAQTWRFTATTSRNVATQKRRISLWRKNAWTQNLEWNRLSKAFYAKERTGIRAGAWRAAWKA